MAIDKADAFISINANGPERPDQEQIERSHTRRTILRWLHFTLEQSTIYAYKMCCLFTLHPHTATNDWLCALLLLTVAHTRCNLQFNARNGFGVD